MTDGVARQTGLLTVLLAILARDGLHGPSDLAVAGALGLAVYAVIGVGPSVTRRLLDVPPPEPPAADEPTDG